MKEKKNMLMVLAVIVLSIGIVFFMAGTEPRGGQQQREGGEEGTAVHDANDAEVFRELEITLSVSELQLEHLQRLSEALTSNYSQLSVELIHDQAYEQTTDEFIAHVKRAISRGESSDVLLVDNLVAAKLAAEGYVLTLDGAVPTSAYHPALVEPVRWNGSVWGLPWTADPYVFVWHPEGFVAAGFNHGLPDTIYDLEMMQQQLTEKRSLLHIEPGDTQAAFALMNVWPEGMAYVNVEAIDEWTDSVSNSESETDSESVWTLLRGGHMLMHITRASALSDELEEAGFQVELLSRLHFDDHAWQEAGWIGGTSFVVAATTKLKQEAIAWIEQIAADEAHRTMLKSGQSFERRPFEMQQREALMTGEAASFLAPTGAKLHEYDELLDQFWARELTAEQLLDAYEDWFEQVQP